MQKKKAYFALLILVVLGLFAYVRYSNKLVDIAPDVMDDRKLSDVPTNTSPIPFEDLTVPYLRTQSFISQLSDLDLVSQNGSYKSYLTSYTSDNLKINGLLTIPDGQKPDNGWPAIVFIHGYIPPTLYKTRGNYEAYVDYLAKNGFVVFKIDLRGHDASEGEAGGAYYSSDYIKDTLNAYAALQSADFIDASKIGLWGHSMAGNVVLRSIAVEESIPAAVIWGGAVYSYEDMQKYGIDDNSYRPPSQDTSRQRRRQALFDAHGQFDPASPFWQKVVPTNYLDNISTAIQLDHAVNDDVVNIGYSRDLFQILQTKGITSELNEYPSGGHNITSPSFEKAMQDTVRFFNTHL